MEVKTVETYWYWIIAGVVLLAAFKVWYVPKWLKQQADKRAEKQRLLEQDDE